MKNKHFLFIASLVLAACSADKPVDIGNNRLLNETNCEKLHEDKQITENEIERLKDAIHVNNVAGTLDQVANILRGKFEFGKYSNSENERLLAEYTERQTILEKQISLHCSK